MSTVDDGSNPFPGPPPDEVERLSLVNEAIWVLVSRRLGLTEEDLRATVGEVLAAREQSGIGRPRPCPACPSMVPADRRTCQFCGAVAPSGGPIG